MLKKLETPAELAQINTLSEYAFNHALSPEMNEYFLNLWKQTTNWGIVIDDVLVSQILVFPFKVNLFGESIKMAGIGNVATYPEYRGTGSISKLFNRLFEELKENETVLSYLAPFSQPFYRKYGYELMFNKIESIVARKDISQLKNEKTGRIQRVDPKEQKWQEIVKQLYKDTLEKKTGSIIREDWWWETVFTIDPNKKLAICFDEAGVPAGYLFYKMTPKELVISEISTKNMFAVRKFGAFISSHEGTFETFRYDAAVSDQVELLFDDTRVVEQKTQAGMMIKIVSFQRLIDQLNFKADVDLNVTFAVEDQASDWNHGTWELAISQGKGRARLITSEIDEKADFRGSIQAWSQVLLGAVSLNKQLFVEKISGASAQQVELLAKAIPVSDLALYDYF